MLISGAEMDCKCFYVAAVSHAISDQAPDVGYGGSGGGLVADRP
jgi:hypothetical protein